MNSDLLVLFAFIIMCVILCISTFRVITIDKCYVRSIEKLNEKDERNAEDVKSEAVKSEDLYLDNSKKFANVKNIVLDSNYILDNEVKVFLKIQGYAFELPYSSLLELVQIIHKEQFNKLFDIKVDESSESNES